MDAKKEGKVSIRSRLVCRRAKHSTSALLAIWLLVCFSCCCLLLFGLFGHLASVIKCQLDNKIDIVWVSFGRIGRISQCLSFPCTTDHRNYDEAKEYQSTWTYHWWTNDGTIWMSLPNAIIACPFTLALPRHETYWSTFNQYNYASRSSF